MSMIRFENVIKKFGERTVLSGISFEAKKGEILFVLGTSGTGKSVLLKNIVGLLRPTSGDIYVDSVEVSRLTEEEYFPVRKKCGMVFQQPALFDSINVFENVAYGLRRHKKEMSEQQIAEKVQSSLELVHLDGTEQKKVGELSYGMQKRVSLARTIALDPQILLFDEPTTGLDPVTTSAINQLIFDLSRKLNTTSMVVSHDMKCALSIADRIMVLDKGQIVAFGTPDEMKKSTQPLVKDFLAEVLHESVD